MTNSSWSRAIGNSLGCLLGIIVAASLATPAFGDEAKARAYELAAAPLEIHDRLADLKIGPVPRLPQDERALLAQIWELQAKQSARPIKIAPARLLDAMLFASGIEDADQRRKYRGQFETLTVKARESVKDAPGPRQRGERLMKFLHATVMSKGYDSDQTSLALVFDTGRFNCVSATAMYYLVGTELGLDLRAISIPGSGFLAGHASLDMVEGNKRIQVEPTNPDGFDWATKVNRPGVIVLGYVPDRKDGHEVDGPGIAAMIYSNRGVVLAGEKPPRRLDAVRCYLAALALDPADETARHNLLSVFVNWGPALTAEKQFEDALRVLAFGLSIAPKSEPLHTNHRRAWSDYVEATLAAGKDPDAMALIARAAKAVADDEDFQSASHWFRRHGEKRIKQDGWEAGLAVVARGVRLLPADEGKKLLEWRSSVFRQWSQSLLDKGDSEGSLKVLKRGYTLDPTDKEMLEGIAYHTQEALRMAEAKGLKAVIDHFTVVRKQFPEVDEVAEAGARHAARAVEKLADAKKFKDAVGAVDQYQPLLTRPEQRAELGAIAFDGWGRHLADNKEWQAALAKYAQGLKAFSQQERLLGNAVAAVDRWAEPAIAAKNWDEAIRVYQIGLSYFPGNEHLEHNKKVCEERKRKQK